MGKPVRKPKPTPKQKPKNGTVQGQRTKADAPNWRDRSLWLVAAGIVAVGVVVIVVIMLATLAPRTADTTGTPGAGVEVSLGRGQQLYDANCASCHGANGEGYASRETPAPAVNAGEHAWHHPDDQILALLRNGGMQMPGVGAGWSESDLHSVLAYVKQWWTPEQRRAQQGTIGE